MSPFDEFALEAALRTRDEVSGEVVVVTLGDESSKETLRSARYGEGACGGGDGRFARAREGLNNPILGGTRSVAVRRSGYEGLSER